MAGSKSKVSGKSDRITIDGITAEQFEQLVSILSQWIRSGEVVVRFIMPSAVELKFDEDNISRQLKQNELPPGCISALRYDISFMLQGVLGGHRKVITRFLADNSTVSEVKGEPKPRKEQIRTEVDTRLRCVEEKIVTSDLRRRFAIKKSAKTNTYLGVCWDVVHKRSDSTGSMLPDLVHATVRITAQKPSRTGREEEIFIPYAIAGYGQGVEDFVVTMTLEDLRELAEELGNAVRALKQVADTEWGP